MKDNMLYRIHPLLAGTLEYWLKIKMHTNAIISPNYYNSILGTAHLYNAAKESSLLDSSWEDMEYIMKQHTTT